MEFVVKNPKMYSQDAIEEDTLRNGIFMSSRRRVERPTWSSNGTMHRRATKKHYIPKHPFYYSAQELFEGKAVEEPRSKSDEVKDYVDAIKLPSADEARRAFSAPYQPRSASGKEQEPISEPQSRCPSRITGARKSGFGSRTRPDKTPEPEPITPTIPLTRPRESPPTLKSGAYQKTFPDSVPWHLSGVPGIRVLPEHDHYRRKALDMKNTDIFHIDSGIIPKYLGYVPGLKFRHGARYGRLTYNAREIGVEISPTWGGAVSLLFR